MKKFYYGAILTICLACTFMQGCDSGASTGSGNASSGAGGTTAAPKKIDVAKLPKLSDYLPPLSNSTVELAGPDGWPVLPKTNDAGKLAWFYYKDKTKLPRLEIKEGANPVPSITDVTEANLVDFTKGLQAELKKTKTDKEIIEHCMAIILGDAPWVRHVRVAKNKSGSLVQIQSLQTVRNDKLYSVELLVDGTDPEEMKKYKTFGYAVAAGMKFAGK